MAPPPLEYAEYKSLIDILEASSNENAPTYEDLMKKEQNVLSTVNHVVNSVRDRQADSFVDKTVEHVFEQFFLTFPVILRDIASSRSIVELIEAASKEDRLVYLGIGLVVLSLLTYLIL